jgi:transcriptional regulator with XRE-family HTH domain
VKFKELLKEVDVTGTQLARRLGITRAAVAKWCSGEASPPCSKMNDIAKALHVNVERVVACFVEGMNGGK